MIVQQKYAIFVAFEQKIKVGNAAHYFFLLNFEASTHRRDTHIQVFLNILKFSYKILEYLSDIPCCVTGIIFNQSFELVITSDCRAAENFSDFQIKMFICEPSKPLMNININYSTISIKGTYIFTVCTSIFPLL